MNSAPPLPENLGRRARKKLETRRRILDAALSLMGEHGYDNVKIEQIAAKADVANATFFLHFPTKGALITAFNELVSDKIKERLSEFDLGAIEQLELLRAIMLDEWGRYGDVLRGIVADAAGDTALITDSSDSLLQLAQEIIEKGQAEGSLSRDYDAPLVAQCLAASWRATTLKWAISGDAKTARRDNRQTLDLILHGIAVR